MKSSRKLALLAGEYSYFTGNPCVKGHVSTRRAKTGECLECRALFLISWREKNKLSVQKHNQTQYEKHAEKIKKHVRKYHESNKDIVNQKKRDYQKRNLHLYAKIKAKRKAAQLKRTPKWVGPEEHWLIKEAYALAALRTKVMGFSWHVDHIVPLQGKIVSGLHVPNNLQVIPAVVNIRKGDRL